MKKNFCKKTYFICCIVGIFIIMISMMCYKSCEIKYHRLIEKREITGVNITNNGVIGVKYNLYASRNIDLNDDKLLKENFDFFYPFCYVTLLYYNNQSFDVVGFIYAGIYSDICKTFPIQKKRIKKNLYKYSDFVCGFDLHQVIVPELHYDSIFKKNTTVHVVFDLCFQGANNVHVDKILTVDEDIKNV